MEKVDIRVLVVDDEESVLKAIEDSLARRGLTVNTCQSAEDALTYILQYPYDVVLSDVRMPGMTGVDLLHQIQRMKPGLPVVLMSAYTDVDPMDMLIEGAKGFLHKPFTDMLIVINTLKKACGREVTSTSPGARGPRPAP